MRIIKSLSTDIDLLFTYLMSHCDVHEVAIIHWPYSFVLHIQDFSQIFFVEDFHLNQLVVEFTQRIFSPEKISYFFDGEGADMSAF